MRRHDGNLIEEAIESGNRCGKNNGDLVGRDDLGADRSLVGAERVSSRGMERGIHQPLHGEGNIFGRKRTTVGERNSTAQFERNLLAVFRYLPRFRQFWFELLRVPVDARQYSSRQVTDGKGRIVIDQERIESLRFRAQAKTQFAAALREAAQCQRKKQRETD